jgi:predicted ATPase
MKLLAFRVTEFRSVDDSGWIDTDDVTALIGTNEAGKTNVLVPLWKLKPAKNGAIEPLADYPRKRYNEIRGMKKKPVFIRAKFELAPATRKEVAQLLKIAEEKAKEAVVSRDFDGKYYVEFPKAGQEPTVATDAVAAEITSAQTDVAAAKPVEGDEAVLPVITEALEQAAALLAEVEDETLEVETRTKLLEAIDIDLSAAPKHSVVAARHGQVVDAIKKLHAKAPANDWQAARNLVHHRLPSFVYYSNYGNLDSEIYLPHVIENLKRTDLGVREQAKVRTLKVLFDFVKLSAEEIQALGQDVPTGQKASPELDVQIQATAQKKKERDVLLQSASTDLTRKFREWWKQGDYKFRFAADGNHFRIWVSDDKRPEDIELESRSTGLQWFLSFYLVFLVESEDSHDGAILLLDEPGLTLHPLAQNDLSKFFESLATTNQLVYTTHSPFMVDADHLDRARAVYADKSGISQVSPDLRAPSDKSDQAKSIYAAWAAVGVSTAESVLLGCQAVVVEGASDQHYFTAIKNYLIGKGDLKPTRDLLFLPSNGVKGAKAVCSLVMGKDDALPHAILDSDDPGKKFAESLKSGLYSGDKTRVHLIGDFITVPNAEIEDLFPAALIARVVDRYLTRPSGVDEDFADVVEADKAIVPQVETYAAKHGIPLDEGWKVDVARRVKTAILKAKEDPLASAPMHVAAWTKLFGAILA